MADLGNPGNLGKDPNDRPEYGDPDGLRDPRYKKPPALPPPPKPYEWVPPEDGPLERAAKGGPPVPQQQELSPATSSASGATGGSSALTAAYSKFLGSPTPAAPVSSSLDLSKFNEQLTQLSEQSTQDRARQQQERAAMRELLQGRIAQASAPVDVNAPGIKQQLAAQRLARQRSSERMRSQSAARLSQEGLLDSGTFDTQLAGIEEARGEGESSDIADVLGSENQAKRQELLQLYNMALAQGDTESAATLQQQLAALSGTLQAAGAQEDRRRFSETTNMNQSNFMNELGLKLAQMRG